MSTEPIFDRDGIRAIVVGPVVVAHYHGPVVVDALREFVALRRTWAEVAPATLSIISASTPRPPPDVVAAIYDLARSSHPAIVCEAAVIQAGGPFVVAGRAIIDTLFSRIRPTPSRLFSRVSDAAHYVSDALARPGFGSVLELAVAYLESVATGNDKGSGAPSQSGVRFLDRAVGGHEAAPSWPPGSSEASSRKAR